MSTNQDVESSPSTLDRQESPSKSQQGHSEIANETEKDSSSRGWRFWFIMLAIQVALFAAVLDIAAVSTALPVITSDLHGIQFIWVGSAYTLASTAFLPMSGGLAQMFGRRVVMLGALAFFALGSALCGAAPSMQFLIAGRAVQGLGSGGIISLSQIILADMVTLRERGLFNGLTGLVYGVGSSIGPVIGGALADRGAWRWLFYLNLFITGIAAVLVLVFLNLKTPSGTLREKLARMDWLGNFIIVSSTTACIIGLTWGGVTFPWTSSRVLVPLVLGVVGMGIFMVYEAMFATYPLVPISLVSNRTSLSGYLQTFILPFTMFGTVYYLPVYYQGTLSLSPTLSGALQLPFGIIGALAGIIAGVAVTKSGRYRSQTWVAWALCMAGCGVLSILRPGQKARSVGFQLLLGVPVGMLRATSYFPILAPLPVKSNASALAFMAFVRSLGTVYGITIGGSILQNSLLRLLPQTFSSTFPQGSAIAYAIIPTVASLPEPLRSEVQGAFSGSVNRIYQVLIGVSGLGLLVSLVMRQYSMHTATDEDWDVAENEKKVDDEK